MTISRDNETHGCFHLFFLREGNGPILTNIILMPILCDKIVYTLLQTAFLLR